MTPGTRFAKRVFLVAGIYACWSSFRQYSLEARIAKDFPPPITHPEYFYGFIGVALAWQVAFLLIARDVQRYRLMMLPAILEKQLRGIPAMSRRFRERPSGSVLLKRATGVIVVGLGVRLAVSK